MENLMLGKLIIPVEDEDGIIEYEWNDLEMIKIITELGYSDAKEIAGEVMVLSCPWDALQMFRAKYNNYDLDIVDLTIEMFEQSIKDEF
jgi:hypothetical protein